MEVDEDGVEVNEDRVEVDEDGVEVDEDQDGVEDEEEEEMRDIIQFLKIIIKIMFEFVVCCISCKRPMR